MPGVTIEGLQKWYGGSQVIRDLHLTIRMAPSSL